MSELIPFIYEGSPVRVVQIDSEPWFVAADVCDFFGVTNRNRVMQRVDPIDKGGTQMDTPGGSQKVTIVNESGLYTLLFHLQPTKARGLTEEEIEQKTHLIDSFRRWVTHEVLPSIRKHGGFLTDAKLEEVLSDPDTLIRLATDLKAERARRAELENKISIDEPKVIFADAVAASRTSILVGDLAKILRGNRVEVGAVRLFAWLRRNGFLVSRSGTDYNSPTQRSMELGLFEVKETAITHSDGHVTISKTPKVTGKGQRYFIERFLDGRFSMERAA